AGFQRAQAKCVPEFQQLSATRQSQWRPSRHLTLPTPASPQPREHMSTKGMAVIRRTAPVASLSGACGRLAAMANDLLSDLNPAVRRRTPPSSFGYAAHEHLPSPREVGY